MAPRLDAMSFVVRTSVTPGALTEPVRRAIGEVDSNLALGQLWTLQETLDRAAAQMAFTMALLVIAAGVSLTLGVVGIYGAADLRGAERRCSPCCHVCCQLLRARRFPAHPLPASLSFTQRLQYH